MLNVVINWKWKAKVFRRCLGFLYKMYVDITLNWVFMYDCTTKVCTTSVLSSCKSASLCVLLLLTVLLMMLVVVCFVLFFLQSTAALSLRSTTCGSRWWTAAWVLAQVPYAPVKSAPSMSGNSRVPNSPSCVELMATLCKKKKKKSIRLNHLAEMPVCGRAFHLFNLCTLPRLINRVSQTATPNTSGIFIPMDFFLGKKTCRHVTGTTLSLILHGEGKKGIKAKVLNAFTPLMCIPSSPPSCLQLSLACTPERCATILITGRPTTCDWRIFFNNLFKDICCPLSTTFYIKANLVINKRFYVAP